MKIDRRQFIRLGFCAGTAVVASEFARASQAEVTMEGNEMKLGIVTFNIAKDWSVPTIIEKCKTLGFDGVELRTTHAHGVEPSLGKGKRDAIRKQFETSGVRLWGLGSVCEFHSDDASVVKKNIEDCKDFVTLARDVGAKGVKVRPNGLQVAKGIPEEQTLEQIGRALRECGEFASEHGVEIWVEVHGHDTQHPPRMRKILDICGHPSVGICWNSNPTDVKNGSVKEYFDLLAPYLKSCHINELWKPDYPWRELFSLLKESGYDRFALAEIPDSPDTDRLLRYYRALWQELTR